VIENLQGVAKAGALPGVWAMKSNRSFERILAVNENKDARMRKRRPLLCFPAKKSRARRKSHCCANSKNLNARFGAAKLAEIGGISAKAAREIYDQVETATLGLASDGCAS